MYQAPLRGIILLLIAAPFFAVSQGEAACSDAHLDLITIPFRKGDCWGYADTSGKIVIEPAFEETGVFRLGRGKIKENGLYGFIDHRGNIVIEPEFSDAGDFEWGIARVTLKGIALTIDRTGVAVNKMPESCCLGSPSTRSHFSTYRKEGKTGAISKVFIRAPNSRKMIRKIDSLPAIYDEIKENYCGIAAVRSGQKWGVIDASGTLVLPFQFDSILFRQPFPLDGGAFYYGKINQGNKWGFIDPKGKVIVPPKYESVEWFDWHVARVMPFGAPPGYIDIHGREYFDN